MAEQTYHGDLDLTGEWWLPESPNMRISGQLLRNGANPWALLRLHGDVDPQPSREDTWPEWSVIWGDCKGVLVTVIEPWATRSERSLKVVDDQLGFETKEIELQMSHVLVGCHLDSTESPIFRQQSIWIEGLTQWAFEGTARATWAEGVQYVEQFEWNEHSGQVTVANGYFDAKWTATGQIATQVTKGSLSLQGPALSFTDSLRLAEKIRGLITFSTLQGSHYERLMLWDLGGTPFDVISGMPSPALSQFVPQEEMIVSLKDAPLSKILDGWDGVWTKHEPVLSMILDLLDDKASLPEARVVLTVAAAESLQSGLGKIPAIPQEEYSQILAKIDGALGESERAWVRGRLRNEAGLGQRLASLAGGPLSGFIPDVSAYTRDATRARNSLAHGRGGLEVSDVTMALVETLTLAVVVLRLLLEMGFGESHISHAMSRNRRLTHARMAAHKFYPE